LVKEERNKAIPINRHVKEVLAGLPRHIDHDFVFTYRGAPITSEGGIKNSFKRACQEANITCGRDIPDGLIFHDLRRTVKTNMVNACVDHRLCNCILGHAQAGMDVHYIHPIDEDLHRAISLYTAWLDQAIPQSVDQNVDQGLKEG
jgi:integrase